jgi:hypothetical protein
LEEAALEIFSADAGWINATGYYYGSFERDWLGIPAILRWDWWRREGDLLAENWILIDFPHAFFQLDIDLFARMARLRAARGEV